MTDKIILGDLEKLEKLGYLDHIIPLACSYRKRENKSLNMIVHSLTKRVYFTVTDHKKTIAEVPDLKDAIKTYNNI